MKQLTAELAADLASGSTTLCWCWRLSRRDGVQFGFTDHDHDLLFEGTTFEAVAGFQASEITDSVGLNVDNLEVSSALSSQRLTEEDLAAGLYDDARVEIYRVDWTASENRVLMRTGSLGEVRRAGNIFAAEVRGLAHYLQQTSGRLFQFTCDADVGDSRCGIDLTQAQYQGSGTIAVVSTDRRFTADGLNGFDSDWFTRGLLTFVDGAAAGQSIEVKSHVLLGTVATLELWQPVRQPLQAGQAFTVTAGCDKTLSTCVAKFANAAQFRGFPHMPGNEFVTTFARPGRKAN